MYRNILFTAPPAFAFDINQYKETIYLKEGQSTTIEIPFAGNPQPTAKWTFNGGSIPTSKRFMPDTIWNFASLCIGHAEVNDSGSYDLTLENKYGKVTISIKVKVTGVPSAPIGLNFTDVRETSVTLRWEPPKNDGGSKVTGYLIEKRDPFRSSYTRVGTTKDTQFNITRLVEGSNYLFQVSAENDVGIGESAELTQSIKVKSPHSEFNIMTFFDFDKRRILILSTEIRKE